MDKFTHEHIGQLNTYVSWYADNEMSEGDNPPVGVLLCTEKDHTVVKYALAGMSNQLFVSKYQVALPTEAEIQRVLAGYHCESSDRAGHVAHTAVSNLRGD